MFQDGDEEILVVPRDRLFIEPVHGFVRGKADVYLARIRDHGVFRPRATVEQDSSFKQIIPYLIVRHAGRLFLCQRSTQGGEGRLHGKYSIGLGGHINRRDVEGAEDVIAAGLRRELEEELLIRGPWRARAVGVLNDDSNPVGQVHFGLVHVVEVDSPGISVRESDTLAGRLASLQEVRAMRGHMETWSRLILDAADPTAL
ncbi:MAG TPA: phosphoesterase [bacterium]|nr:phosphoesterase [bacterium]